MIGAVLVENEHHKEIYLKKMVFDGLPQGQINVTCGSYIHSKFDNPEKRVFFTNKASYHSPFLYISCDNFFQMVSFTKFYLLIFPHNIGYFYPNVKENIQLYINMPISGHFSVNLIRQNYFR